MKFKKKYGHCDPASVRGIKDPLVKWVNNQRQHKTKHDNGYTTPINDERIQLLTDNGLEWNPSQDEKVNRRDGGQSEETKAANWKVLSSKSLSHTRSKRDIVTLRRGIRYWEDGQPDRGVCTRRIKRAK